MKPLRSLAIVMAAVLAACSPAKKEAAQAPGGATTIRFATDWNVLAERQLDGLFSARRADVAVISNVAL